MLAKSLIQHQWKSFIRNARWRRNIVSRIMLSFLVLYFAILAIVVGQNIDKLLKDIGGNPIDTFNSALLFYFFCDLFLRCFFQQMPSIQIVPYLSLNIRRTSIFTFLIYRSFWNIFNILPFFIVIPFVTKLILPSYGTSGAIIYVITLTLWLLVNHFMAMVIGYLSKANGALQFIPFALAGCLFGFQKLGVPIKTWSIALGHSVATGNGIVILLLILVILISGYFIFKLLINNFYFESPSNSSSVKKSSTWMDIFRKYGEAGKFVALELKLLMRNKRPRQMLAMFPVLILYMVFIILKDKNMHQDSFVIIMLVSFLLSLGSSVYGQYLFSWESNYFDGILTRKINFLNYIKAKYLMLVSFASFSLIILLVITCFVHLINPLLLLAFFIFSIGPLAFIIIFFGTFNDARLDLNQSSFFNYQGVKGNQFILTFILMLLPIGIYSLFKYLTGEYGGILSIAIPGLTFVILNKWWIKTIVYKNFIKRKYKNLEGYRKLSA